MIATHPKCNLDGLSSSVLKGIKKNKGHSAQSGGPHIEESFHTAPPARPNPTTKRVIESVRTANLGALISLAASEEHAWIQAWEQGRSGGGSSVPHTCLGFFGFLRG